MRRDNRHVLKQVYQSIMGIDESRSLALRPAFTKWINDNEAASARKTVQKYRAIAKQFCDYFQADDNAPLADEITTDSIRAFLDNQGTVKSPGTVNVTRKVLSAFFRSLGRENPVAGIRAVKDNTESVRRPFTLPEISLVFKNCPNDFWRFMVMAGFFTGQRLGDLACLRVGNVDLQTGMLRITSIKTGKTVNIPIHPVLRELIQVRLGKLTKGKAAAYLWPEQAAVYNKRGSGPLSAEFYEILSSCGLVAIRMDKKGEGKGRDARRITNELSFHCLRHTFVSLLKITGANQATAKELAGHSSDAVNDNYTHLPEATLREAINNLPKI